MGDKVRRIVLAGVSGCGKTAVGRELARMLDADFIDADDFHSAAAVAKMTAGKALDDEDRRGWLTVLGETVAGRERSVVLACSALKRAYRERLRELCDGLQFVMLKADPEVIRMRMERRQERGGHFMPVALLESQLATLEEGDDVTPVENLGEVVEVAERIRRMLGNR